MSKLHGGRVASAVALMFAAGGVAAAEPAVAPVVEASVEPAASAVPDTICGRVVPDTMCAHAEGTTETICGRLTEAEEQPSTWCLIATED